MKKWLEWLFGKGEKTLKRPAVPEPGINSPVLGPEAASSRSINIELEILNRLFPIRTLNEDVLRAFVLDHKADVYPAGSILFRIGEPAHSVHYLLEGSVLLETAEGQSYEIQAYSIKARFPLCSGKQYSATAKAVTEIQVLRVSSEIMRRTQTRVESMNTIIDSLVEDLPQEFEKSRVFKAFCHHCLGAKLELPTLPALAVKLGQAISRDCNLRELAGHIQLDPVIAARLISVANSPLYHAGGPVNSCQDAIAILGTFATRNLVVGMCLRRVFESKDPHITRLLHEQWRKSVYLSSLCFVLAGENGGVDREQALLAGLISDIGVLPFLHFLGNQPGEPWEADEIQSILDHVRGPVGSFLLNQWRFPEELANIPLLAENWCYESGQPLGLADIVILSKLHSYIGTPHMAELPAINSIPAFSKLKEGRLSPEFSLDMLVRTKHKIQQTMKIFVD